MFSYFGSKSKVVKLYPRPKFDKIIEPFAGSARYSLQYFDRDITIIDKYENVIDIWKYLQNASEKDILSLPAVKPKTKLETLTGLTETEKSLIYFCTSRGNGYVGTVTGGGDFNNWERDKIRIASSLHKIKHWNIILGDYTDVQNEEATWFIDAPYQFVKRRNYKHSNIDYEDLKKYCLERKGQVIVCENDQANWLPFEKLSKLIGLQKETIETIWTNET